MHGTKCTCVVWNWWNMKRASTTAFVTNLHSSTMPLPLYLRRIFHSFLSSALCRTFDAVGVSAISRGWQFNENCKQQCGFLCKRFQQYEEGKSRVVISY